MERTADYHNCDDCFWNDGSTGAKNPCGQYLCYDDEHEHLKADYQPDPDSPLAILKAIWDFKEKKQ